LNNHSNSLNCLELNCEAEICAINEYGNGDIDYRLRLKKAGIEGTKEKE